MFDINPARVKAKLGMAMDGFHVRFIVQGFAVPLHHPSATEELGEATTDVANNVGEPHQGKNHHTDGVTALDKNLQVEKWHGGIGKEEMWVE